MTITLVAQLFCVGQWIPPFQVIEKGGSRNYGDSLNYGDMNYGDSLLNAVNRNTSLDTSGGAGGLRVPGTVYLIRKSSGDSLLNSVSKASEEISELSPELESWDRPRFHGKGKVAA